MNVALGSIQQNQNTIPSGQKLLSEPITTNGLSLCGIFFPGAMTGTSISFLAAEVVGGPYLPIFNGSGILTYAIEGSQYIAIDPEDFYGVQFLQIESNANEVATRSLTCAMKGL